MLPTEFLAYLVILCVERRCPQQNTVARLNSKIPPPKFGLATPLRVTDHWLRSLAKQSKFLKTVFQNFLNYSLT